MERFTKKTISEKHRFTSYTYLTIFRSEATIPMVSQEKNPSNQSCEPGLPGQTLLWPFNLGYTRGKRALYFSSSNC